MASWTHAWGSLVGLGIATLTLGGGGFLLGPRGLIGRRGVRRAAGGDEKKAGDERHHTPPRARHGESIGRKARRGQTYLGIAAPARTQRRLGGLSRANREEPRSRPSAAGARRRRQGAFDA